MADNRHTALWWLGALRGALIGLVGIAGWAGIVAGLSNMADGATDAACYLDGDRTKKVSHAANATLDPNGGYRATAVTSILVGQNQYAAGDTLDFNIIGTPGYLYYPGAGDSLPVGACAYQPSGDPARMHADYATAGRLWLVDACGPVNQQTADSCKTIYQATGPDWDADTEWPQAWPQAAWEWPGRNIESLTLAALYRRRSALYDGIGAAQAAGAGERGGHVVPGWSGHQRGAQHHDGGVPGISGVHPVATERTAGGGVMTLLLWMTAFTLVLVYVPAGPWSALALPILGGVMLAGCWAIGISASDRAYPTVVVYVVSFGLYCSQMGWIAERVNLALSGAPDPWPAVAVVAFAFVIPATFVVSPTAQWIYETARDDKVENAE